VHLAAIDFGVPARPEEYFGVNVMGTWNVLQAAEEAGIHRVVVTSSISANGLSEVRPDAPPAYLPVDEGHPLVPASAYGLSKEAVEVVARGFARHRMTVPCLRPVAVVFPWTVERFVARSQDPEAAWLGAYVSVEDTARAFRLALEADGLRGFQTFYLAAPDSWSEEPTLDRVRRLWGDLPELRDAERYARDPGASMIDCRAAREGLGWEARLRWPELQARRRG
jgi:UDP-glucose 4-epimerase